MKAISSIFSTVIVIVITLSLLLPLYLYFYNVYNINKSSINVNYGNLVNEIETKISVIPLNYTSSGILVYNYGNVPATITSITIMNRTYHVKYIIYPGEMIRISSILGSSFYVEPNSTIILQINGNYYYYQI